VEVRCLEDNGRYYSVLGGVHHTQDDCPSGRLIPEDFKRKGSGGLPLCPACHDRVVADQQRRTKHQDSITDS